MRYFNRFMAGVIVTTGFMASFSAGAQKRPPPPPAPVPAIEKIDIEALHGAVQAALACGASYIVRNEETNQCGFLYAPLARSKVVSYKGFKEVEIHYKKVETPIYKPIYQNYETFEVATGASGADARNLRKVIKRRIVGQEKVGTKTEERLVREKDGPIVIKHKVPIDPVYERRTVWPDGLLGLNGMGMYILIKCGYYEKTNIIQVVARNLENHMEYFGLPDMTWDVAWLAAAFANIPDPKFEGTRDKLINKLLDGQIVEGAARGMWGPVCIRADTLAAMLAYEQTLGKTAAKAKGKAQGKDKAKGGKQNIELAAETEDILKEFAKSYLLFAQQGTRFDDITTAFVFGPTDDQNYMSGLPYYIYDQAVADMESTALALFAVREAAENKCLPVKTVKPVGARKRILLEGEAVPTILARSASAITSMQKAGGAWDECNIHQATKAFAPFGFPQRTPENVWQLASPVTSLSTIQALSALIDVGYVVGYDKLLAKFRDNITGGYAGAVASLQTFLENPVRKDGVGRLIPPYDLTAKGGVLLRGGSLFGDNRRDLWVRMAYLLATRQRDDGSWQAPDGMMLSSGLVPYWETALRKSHEKQMERLPEAKRTPLNLNRARARLQSEIRLLPGDYLATCYAMLSLLDGVREPLAGFYSDTAEVVTSPALSDAVTTLGREKDLLLTPLRVTSKTPVGLVLRLPVLMLAGSAVPSDPTLKALVAGYAAGTGFLVIDRPAMPDGNWEAGWASVVGGRAGNVPEDFGFLKDLRFKVALRGLFGATGQLTGIFLPRISAQGGDGITAVQASTLLAAIIRSYADTTYFERDYAVKIKGFSGEPFVARVALLDQLGVVTPVVPQSAPAPAAPPVEKPADKPATETVKPPEVTPPAETEPVESTESGIPLPKVPEAAAPKADETW